MNIVAAGILACLPEFLQYKEWHKIVVVSKLKIAAGVSS